MAKRQRVIKRPGTERRFSKRTFKTGVQRPNKEVVAEYRARARVVDEKELRAFSRNPHFVNIPRQLALQLRARVIQDAGPEHFVSILKSQIRNVRMYFNNGMYWFADEHVDGGYILVSVKYSDREVALNMFRMERIRWIDCVSIPPPQS